MKRFIILIGVKLLFTILSPIMYGLTNNPTANPDNSSYYSMLKTIWSSSYNDYFGGYTE